MEMVLILVLATIAAFLLIELAYRMWSRRVKEKAGGAVPAVRAALVPVALPEFRLPGGLFYHSGHTWAHLSPSGGEQEDRLRLPRRRDRQRRARRRERGHREDQQRPVSFVLASRRDADQSHAQHQKAQDRGGRPGLAP